MPELIVINLFIIVESQAINLLVHLGLYYLGNHLFNGINQIIYVRVD